MDETWLDQHRKAIFFGILTTALAGIGLFYWRQPSAQPIEIVASPATVRPTSSPTAQPSPTATPVRVYITGAVVNSDVYFLPPGSIVRDVIAAAGGLTAEADPERINLALQLKDQQQVHIPRLGETDAPPPVQGGSAVEPVGGGSVPVVSGPLNLNTATLEQLDALPGIGPAIGQRIIEYRDSVGRFSSIEEITQVSGIGEATFAKIRDQISVD